MDKKCFYCGRRYTASRSNQLYCSERCRNRSYSSGYLILPIKKKWYDMILSGEKTEEYREIKPYWTKRIQNIFSQYYHFDVDPPRLTWDEQPREVLFRNGYGNDKPYFIAECTVSEGIGKPEWGAEPGKTCYIFHIKRIL